MVLFKFRTPAQLLREAQSYSQVTPLQISLVFQLCSMEDHSSGTISHQDFTKLLPHATPLQLPPTATGEGAEPADLADEVSNGRVSLLDWRSLETDNLLLISLPPPWSKV